MILLLCITMIIIFYCILINVYCGDGKLSREEIQQIH